MDSEDVDDGLPSFYLDPQRCIGCHACEMACAECETNGDVGMIHVDYVDRSVSTQTSVQVCMRRPRLRARLPSRRNHEGRVPNCAQCESVALHRLFKLRSRLPVRGSDG